MPSETDTGPSTSATAQPPFQPPAAGRFFLRVDESGLVKGKVRARDDQDGAMEVSADVFSAAAIDETRYVDGKVSPYTPAPAAPVVPDLITDRQCFQQLAALGRVTQDEALAAVTVGALPKAVADGIAGLPADQQFPARMLLCGATEFHRSHPMVPAFLGMLGLSSADGDALWTAAAKL